MIEAITTIPILWRWVLGACAMIVALGSAGAVIVKVFKPKYDFRKEIDTLARKQATDQESNERRFKKDLDIINDLKESNKYLCKGVLALLNHEISGNSVEKLTKARDTMSDYLVEK